MEFRNRFLARISPSCTPRTRRNLGRETTIRLLVNYGIQVSHAAYYTIFPFCLTKEARPGYTFRFRRGRPLYRSKPLACHECLF